ncbi:hypothetical protein GCM10011515_24430 [Tsuneonella deserti]|uniref:Uncharacterized protein n=1 Tax=Tsuneonella deserti TaxID=2035528 RepID=A0ABQ1SAG6_9SPHN|nr:hypothetical protein GCM10011515_24430 [Tsuneonella deserti]
MKLCLRGQEIRQTLRFGKVDPAICKSAPRKLAGLGLAQSFDFSKRAHDSSNYRAAAVQMQFGDILPGCGVWARQPEYQSPVELFSRCVV